MTLLPFALLLPVLCAVLLFLHSDRLRASKWAYGRMALGTFAFALPLLLITVFVDADKDPFGRFTLRMSSLELGSNDNTPPLSIGGEGACDDLLVSGLPAHVARVSPGRVAWSGPGAREGAACAPGADEAPDAAEDSARIALVGVESAGGRLTPGKEQLAGAVTLAVGDRFCLSGCEENAGNWFRVADDGRSIVSERPGAPLMPPLPERSLLSFVPPEVLAHFLEYRAAQAIFPLRDYGLPRADAFHPFDDPCEARQLCNPQTGLPVDSFLFFDDDDRLSLMLLDEGSRYLGGNADPATRPPTELDLPVGGKLNIWEVRYSDPLTHFVEEPRASFLAKRLTLDVDHQGRTTRLGFGEAAPARTISLDQVERVARSETADGEIATAFVGGAPQAEVDFALEDVIRFEGVGGALSRGLLSASTSPIRLSFSEELWTEASRMMPALEGVEDVAEPRFNQTSFVQQASPGSPAQVKFTLDRLVYPYLLLLTVFAWTGVLLYLLWSRLHLHPRLTSILAVLQLLLAWRILVAFGSFGLDPSINPLLPVAQVTLAFVCVPAMLVALMPGPRWRWPELAVTAAVVAALFWSINVTGAVDAKHFALGAGTVVILLLRMVIELNLDRSVDLARAIGAKAAARLPRLDAEATDGKPELAQDKPLWKSPFGGNRRLMWFVVFAFALIAFRIAMLVFLGAREQLFGMRSSIIYLPLAIVIWAGLIDAVKNARTGREILAAALAMVLTAGTPALASDNGFTLIFSIVPMAVLFAVCVRQFDPVRSGTMCAGMALAVAVAVALIAGGGWVGIGIGAAIALGGIGYGVWRQTPSAASGEAARPPIRRRVALEAAAFAMMPAILLVPASMLAALSSEAGYAAVEADPSDTARSPDEVIAQVSRYADEGVNGWRLNAIFNPAAINEAGLDDAERLRRWRFTLERLTEETFGYGFPYQANISDVRVNQADDNVTAVHVMAPFGRAAGAGLILLLATLAMVTIRSAKHVAGMRRWVGVLAIWSFAIAGAYMIAANLMLVPFTGRNLYFLAAFSFSDLAEGTALLLLTGMALGRWPAGKPKEPVQA